jgi:hypothetical protein
MKQGRNAAVFVALASSYAAEPAAAASLRALRGDDSRGLVAQVAGRGDDDPAAGTPAAIHEKWDKMDEFLKVMFTMACKWKHGKDVSGLAAEKMRDGDLTTADEVRDFKKQMQQEHIEAIPETCGKLVASGQGRCRQGCSDRWNAVHDERQKCHDKCITVYTRFESECKAKAEELEKVYDQKRKAADARDRCYEGFCAAFPTVWMKGDAAAMEEERGKNCEGQCTEEAISLSCRQAWQLKADFVAHDVTSACFEEGKVKECYDEKKTAASDTQESCSSDGKAKCEEDFTSCMEKGDSQGKDFCTERKKMCEPQVVEACLKEHKEALDAAQTECEAGDKEALDKCKADKMLEKEQEEEEKCIAERTPACPEDCAKKCPVDKLDGCLKDLETDYDPAHNFCEDFWTLLHESSEVDPVTGNPIVLLAGDERSK